MPVCIKKPSGSLWLCVDPRPLNKYLVCPVQNTDTLEDVLPQFAEARSFTILDAKSGFWQLELEKESQTLTTMAPMFGHYCLQKIPFGLSYSSDLFNAKLQELYQGVDNCVYIADDMWVYGFNGDRSDHDETQMTVLQIAQAKIWTSSLITVFFVLQKWASLNIYWAAKASNQTQTR